MPKLTVQNAEIKTAAVEVQTLTLSGKQVTLSVFKQIQEEPIVDQAGDISGTPWGQVNYHPDKCSDNAAHIHVVWQKGSELRRATVSPDRSPGLAQDAGQTLVEAAISHGVRFNAAASHFPELEMLGTISAGRGDMFGPNAPVRTAFFDFQGIRYAVRISEATYETGQSRMMHRSNDDWPEPRSWANYFTPIASIGMTYRDSYAELLRLPQLFIAV